MVFTGDALITDDTVVGRTGPRLSSRAFTQDSAAAGASLDELAGLPADTVLPGHGDPWDGGIADGVALARAAGIA